MRRGAKRTLVRRLGQAGLRLEFESTVLYFDPYLTNSVERLAGPSHRRLRPAPLRPQDLEDASWFLVSHEHLDHYDPGTLVPAAKAAPNARFIVPYPVRSDLARRIGGDRVDVASELWRPLGPGAKVRAVPAAHPRIARNALGQLRFVGYVLRLGRARIYFAGDTSPHEDITQTLRRLGPFDVGFVPVNERNFYKERQGIVGNMSVRETFALCEEARIRTLVPIHFDMFKPNSIEPDEVRLLYRTLKPDFDLDFDLTEVSS